MTFNEDLFDLIVRHQTGLQRYAGGVRNRAWEELDLTEIQMRRLIERLAGKADFASASGRRRARRLLEELREVRLGGWQDVRALLTREMRDLAKAEAVLFDGMIRSAVPLEFDTTIPSARDLNRIVRVTPIIGLPLSGWIDREQRLDLWRVAGSVNQGIDNRASPRRISQALVGTLSQGGRNGATQASRNGLATLSRTAVLAIARAAQVQWHEENEEIVEKERFVAVLDNRTTAICRSLDGNLYDVGQGPQLPIHPNERSTYSPQISADWAENRPAKPFTEKTLVNEYTRANGLDVVSSRGRLPRGHKGRFDAWARGRKRELTGTVPTDVSYSQWFRRQPVAFQRDTLGPTRFDLWRDGGLSFDQFVAFNGRELTLAELADRHAGAFKRAGLSAADF